MRLVLIDDSRVMKSETGGKTRNGREDEIQVEEMGGKKRKGNDNLEQSNKKGEKKRKVNDDVGQGKDKGMDDNPRKRQRKQAGEELAIGENQANKINNRKKAQVGLMTRLKGKKASEHTGTKSSAKSKCYK